MLAGVGGAGAGAGAAAAGRGADTAASRCAEKAMFWLISFLIGASVPRTTVRLIRFSSSRTFPSRAP